MKQRQPPKYGEYIRWDRPHNRWTFWYTYVPEPNPYTDRAWRRRERARRRAGITHLPAGYSTEEIGRMGQDIDWRWLGTSGR